MNAPTIPNRPLKFTQWLWSATKPLLNDEPVVMRADAVNAHEVVYQGKGAFLVRTNPARQADYEAKRKAIEDACHTKIDGAADVRDKAMVAAKAAYKAAGDAANEAYRTVDAVATKERDAAVAALDREFSAAPVEKVAS